MSEQGVTSVKHVGIKNRGQEKETNTLFLTFCNSSLPKDTCIGYLRVKVDPFVLNPLRCFKCQKYGNEAQRCSSAAVCPKCALQHLFTSVDLCQTGKDLSVSQTYETSNELCV